MRGDNVVGIATSYGLVTRGFEFQQGRHFPQPSRLAMELTHFPINGYLIIHGGKAVEVKKVYNYSSAYLLCLYGMLQSEFYLLNLLSDSSFIQPSMENC